MAPRTKKERVQQAIGACALTWNEAEDLIDTIVGQCLQIPKFLQPLAIRAITLENKVDLIKQRLAHDIGDKNPTYQTVTDLLGHAKALNTRRDYLIHLVPDYDHHTGAIRQWKMARKSIPLDLEGIVGIAAHLDALVEELMLAQEVFNVLYGHEGAPLWIDDPDEQSRQQRLQRAADLVRARLKERQSLPPLPPIPK